MPRKSKGKKKLSIRKITKHVLDKISPPVEVLRDMWFVLTVPANKRLFAMLDWYVTSGSLATSGAATNTIGGFPFLGFRHFDAMRAEYLAQADEAPSAPNNVVQHMRSAVRKWRITNQQNFGVYVKVHRFKAKGTHSFLPMEAVLAAVNAGVTAEHSIDANPFTVLAANSNGVQTWTNQAYTSEVQFNVSKTQWWKEIVNRIYDVEVSKVRLLKPGETMFFRQSHGPKKWHVSLMQMLLDGVYFDGVTEHIMIEATTELGDEAGDATRMGHEAADLLIKYQDKMVFNTLLKKTKQTCTVDVSASGRLAYTNTDLEVAGEHARMDMG